MNLKYTMLGIHLPISCKVLENSKKGDSYVWKCDVKGAIDSQQIWTYIPKGNTTQVAIDIEYELPGKVLGKIADALVVEKIQENAMEQTLKNLKIICEA